MIRVRYLTLRVQAVCVPSKDTRSLSTTSVRTHFLEQVWGFILWLQFWLQSEPTFWNRFEALFFDFSQNPLSDLLKQFWSLILYLQSGSPTYWDRFEAWLFELSQSILSGAGLRLGSLILWPYMVYHRVTFRQLFVSSKYIQKYILHLFYDLFCWIIRLINSIQRYMFSLTKERSSPAGQMIKDRYY